MQSENTKVYYEQLPKLAKLKVWHNTNCYPEHGAAETLVHF